MIVYGRAEPEADRLNAAGFGARPATARPWSRWRAWMAACVWTASGSTALDAGADGPALRIVDGEYRVFPEAYLFRRNSVAEAEDAVPGNRTFGRVAVADARADGSGALRYAVVSDPGAATYRICIDAECSAIAVGVRAASGQLYLGLDRAPSRDDAWRHEGVALVADFPARRVELSVADAATGLRVYREAAVLPSAAVPDCRDYPDADVDRYTCLYLSENLPTDRPDTPDEVRAALPPLVQPRENYELVLAEEFDGTAVDDSGGCENRTGNIDPAVWNYDGDPCNDVDANGVPCFNVADGHVYVTMASGCAGAMSTTGKFSYRYGYLETKFSIHRKHPGFELVLAFVQWAGARQDRLWQYDFERFGIAVDSYEKLSKYFGVEMDHFEYIPGGVRAYEYGHQYMNAWSGVRDANVLPRRSHKVAAYCNEEPSFAHALVVPLRGRCRFPDDLTVVKGVEWTPRGYRTFVKVDGQHDDFLVLPARNIQLDRRPASEDAGGGVRFGGWQSFAPEARREFFEYLRENDAASILEQFGIAHMPADFELTAWGYPDRFDGRIKTRLRLDYVRVFQPADRYAAMEPVYE